MSAPDEQPTEPGQEEAPYWPKLDPAREREWVDITDEVNAMARQRAADPDLQTIELDCPPGPLRPGDLIEEVLEGTGLEVPETRSRFMGNWIWEFRMERARWQDEIQPVIAPRIRALYGRGLIRWGSW